jgi:23S rRNA (cytosine1962-C5)-methyltransferase
MKTITLHPGKERSLLRRHPWVFEGSIARGRADAGETVRVEAADGRFLCLGRVQPELDDPRCAPGASTRPSAWTMPSSSAAWRGRWRCARMAPDSDGVRLVHGEADGLPGLIVDRYGRPAERTVPERRRGALARGAGRHPRGCERLHAPVRALGLWRARARGAGGAYRVVARGPRRRLAMAAPPRSGRLSSRHPRHTWRLTVDVAGGHKTGFYLDQRDNRAAFARWVRQFGVQRVLNCYAYTGGFGGGALGRGRARDERGLLRPPR